MKSILDLISKYNEEYNVYITLEFTSNSVLLIVNGYKQRGTASSGTYLQNKRFVLAKDMDYLEAILKELCEQVQKEVYYGCCNLF